MGYGFPRNPLTCWSGRPDSNRRRPAWEAGILPLNYARPILLIIRPLPAIPLLSLLERHVVGLEQPGAPRLPAEPLVDSVEVELLVERRRGGVLDPELVDPAVLLEALLLVHDRLRLVRHPVELGVVIVRQDAPRAEERHVDGLGVHGRRAPADEPDRPGLVHVDVVVEVRDELVRAHGRADARLGELT